MMATLAIALSHTLAARRKDRGDVPGWVLITVMTAGLVSALWVFAGPALVDLFKSALAGVTGK
jgi:hypothetical protein